MKFAATAAAAAVLATGATAQVSSPLTLLQYASQLLTAPCRQTVTGLVSGSELAQCLQLTNLLPVLNNANSSVIPNVNDYLVDICAAEACSPEVIQNATRQVLSSCSVDLSRFGITNGTVETIMDAYPTARKVACLSTNDTELADSNSTSSANSTNSTLCPTALLYKAEQYLGVNFTNTYATSLILGANATAYRQLLAVPQNGTIVDGLACNDCVAAGLQIVLEDYPQLENMTFNVNSSTVEQYVNVTLSQNGTGPANSTWNVSRLYEGVCDVEVNSTTPLPASINQTAFNSTDSMMMNTTSTALPASTGVSSVRPSAATGTATAVGGPIRSSASAVITSIAAPTSLPVSAPSVVAPATSAVASAVAPTKRWMKWD